MGDSGEEGGAAEVGGGGAAKRDDELLASVLERVPRWVTVALNGDGTSTRVGLVRLW